jgi:beta-hydroxylase
MTTDDRWKTYFLYGYGFKSEANCARCPQAARLCAQIPGMKTAFFSILAPGKHLPAHRGPYKGVMRYHLGLLIPEPAEQCGIRVDTETRHWHEGESMIFDDTYEHEAWNNTDRTRVVLFVDFVRPLRAPARWLNAAVLWAIAFSPFIGDAKRRHNDWEKTFEAMKARRAAA